MPPSSQSPKRKKDDISSSTGKDDDIIDDDDNSRKKKTNKASIEAPVKKSCEGLLSAICKCGVTNREEEFVAKEKEMYEKKWKLEDAMIATGKKLAKEYEKGRRDLAKEVAAYETAETRFDEFMKKDASFFGRPWPNSSSG